MANLTFTELEQTINLLEFALYNGYNLVKAKSTRKNPVLKGGNGDILVLKNADENNTVRYFNASEGSSTTDRGNIIEFVKHRIGSIFPFDNNFTLYGNVNKVLHDYLEIPIERKQYNFNLIPDNNIKEFDINLYSLTKLRKTNEYLNKIRCINPETLNQEAFKNRIFLNNYQGKEYVVFPFYSSDNTTVCGLNFKAENELSKNALHSDKLKGIWTSKIPEKIDTIFICEHPIDATSYNELQPSNNTLFISTFGRPTAEQLFTLTKILEANSSKISTDTVFKTGFDNDFSGQSFGLQNANYFSNGSYFLTYAVNNTTNAVNISIYNIDKLNSDEKQMLRINGIDDFSCNKIFHKIGNKYTNENCFNECANDFKINVDRRLGKEAINIKVDDKKVCIDALKLPQVMNILNEVFNKSFEKLQVTKVVPVVPNRKDFNEDLKDRKCSENKLRNEKQGRRIKI